MTGINEDEKMDDYCYNAEANPGPFASRIVSLVESTLQQGLATPILNYAFRATFPYVIVILLLFLSILTCQTITLWRVVTLSNNIIPNPHPASFFEI